MFLVPQNAGNGISNKYLFTYSRWHLHFQNFPGEHASGPPSKLMLNLIVAMQSLVQEASNNGIFYVKYVKI